MSYFSYRADELVLARARIIMPVSDCFSTKALAWLRFEDFPAANYVATAYVPFSEIARPADLRRLLVPVTIDPTTAARSPGR